MTPGRRAKFWIELLSAFLVLNGMWATAWSDESPGQAIGASTHTIGTHACTSGESWELGELEASLPPRFVDSIHQFLRKKLSTVRGFSEALAMRRQAKTPEEKFFAEYWVSRSLYGAQLVHVAKDGFALIASRMPSPQTAGIQLAALECLVQIHNIYPSIEIPAAVTARIPEYLEVAKPLDRQNVVWDLATQYILAKIAEGKVSEADGERMASYVSGSLLHEALVRGLLAAQRNDHSSVIQNLKTFVEVSGMPDALKRYVTTAHILLARSYYTVEQYDRAIAQFKKVDRKSNDLADSLEELTWAYLMNEQYSETIGTAITLQAGGLRNTYAPEAPMVMAMAMNEICQFPESIRAANSFKRWYEPVYGWLDRWNKGGEKEDLYKLAVKYLKRQGDTPVRLASEWVRSPIFIADQDEINRLFDEKSAASALTKWGSKEQNSLAQSILAEINDIKPAFRKAFVARAKEGKPFPSKLVAEIAQLREDLTAFHNLQAAAPVWKKVLANHVRRAPVIERRLVAEINGDLLRRSRLMHDQLEEIAENIELIEVEIYNGASEDIVWQNAHPDFKKVAKELSDEDTNRAPASKVWDWGKASNITEEGAEIWEDELGSFKADMPDNCTSKDKYLALKGRHH